jgi:hypothetical protein
MANFSLKETDFEVPAVGVLIFGWAGLDDSEIMSQLCFQQQFLSFFRYLIMNLQSTPQERPNLQPQPLSLSLRAGALKAYVQSAVSIIEGALAELGVIRGLGERDFLHRKTFGALLDLWKGASEELVPIWKQLQLLKTYRNFVHLGNAAANADSYWKDLLNRESDLLGACDEVILWLSSKCDGVPDSYE